MSKTQYQSIKTLASFANEIDADEFKYTAKNSGLQLVSIETIPVSKGKGFVRMDFTKRK